MSIDEFPEREYIINWFGIGSDLVKMLKDGLSPIQCMKRLRKTRLRERIIRCKDCKHCEKFYVCFSDKPLYYCNSGWHEGNEPIVKPDWYCACAESKVDYRMEDWK